MDDFKWKTAVITLSDKGYRGEREDKSGPLICEMLPEDSYSIVERLLLPDEQEMIEKEPVSYTHLSSSSIYFFVSAASASVPSASSQALAASLASLLHVGASINSCVFSTT